MKPARLTPPASPSPRRKRLRVLIVLSSLPLFGTLAAFGLAPDTLTAELEQTTVVDSLTLPARVLAPIDAGTYLRQETIRPGDTLAAVLARMDVAPGDVQQLLAHPEARAIAADLRTGQTVEASTSDTGDLIELRQGEADKQRVAKRAGDSFVVDEVTSDLDTRTVMLTGVIESSLFAAADRAGLPDKIANQLADVFSAQIDFRDDLRKGDTFSVVFSMLYRNGEPVFAGRILAAEFVNRGQTHQAALFLSSTGKADYYTPDGRSLKKGGFLRSPLEFSRVTSGFSNSRKHPVYGFHRAHLGVDFGAPTGTRVRATGAGTVKFAGRKGSYGNLVILRHDGGLETYYAHLHALAPGIRAGKAVEQGQLIAYVGSTGASTGPHLHYEVRVAGTPSNPLTVKLPGAPSLSTEERRALQAQSGALVDRLALLRGANLAALD